jgi:hypothetical protein
MSVGRFTRSVSLAILAVLGACARPAVDEGGRADVSSESPSEAPAAALASAPRVAPLAPLVPSAVAPDDDLLVAIRRGGSFDVTSFLANGALSPGAPGALAAPRALAELVDGVGGGALAKPKASKATSLVEPPEPPDLAAADDARCPQGMQLIEGESCWDVQHTCVDSMKDGANRCREFKKGADVCVGAKTNLKYCMDRYEWPGVPGAKPRVIVTYYEAERLCKSIGKRMCGEQEFYLACEGPEHWPFAWGHSRYPSTCNIDRPYANVDWGKWSTQPYAEAKRLDQALPIGTSKCWSAYGIHDIAGNVDEWTKARQGREYAGSLNGGYWGPVANACRYVTTVHGPEFAFYQIGFRCCADAKE